MLRTKFRGICLPVLEKKTFECFYKIWAWPPSWSCDPYFVIKLSFPYPLMLHIKFHFDWPCSFREEEL